MFMDTRSLIAQIDAEIANLQRARQALASINSSNGSAKRRGRPPKNATAIPVSSRKRRKLSREAKAKISAAQKKRWAAQKRTSTKASGTA